MHPDSSAATRTRPDPYSSRAFVSSHSRKLANAQTERSVAATSTVLVTESVLSSAYQHCYWMFLSRRPIATTDSRTRIDSYSSRAFVSSHSRKLANAQTERSVAATSAVFVTESELSSMYQHCYWMHWEPLYHKMISQHYTVYDDDTWLSNYYHTIYIWRVHLCKELDDGKNYTCTTTWECFTWNICKSNTSYYKYNYIIPANLGV